MEGLETAEEKLAARNRFKARLASVYNIDVSAILDAPTTSEKDQADSMVLMFKVAGEEGTSVPSHYVFVSHGLAPEVGTEFVMRLAPPTASPLNDDQVLELMRTVSKNSVMSNFVSVHRPIIVPFLPTIFFRFYRLRSWHSIM